jgi:hypothetical protein
MLFINAWFILLELWYYLQNKNAFISKDIYKEPHLKHGVQFCLYMSLT